MVDERYISKDHQDSNQKAISDTLLKGGLISSANLVFPNVSLPLDDCISDYNEKIKNMLESSKTGCVTISILGIGEDGHFASLFPHSEKSLIDSAFSKSKYEILLL